MRPGYGSERDLDLGHFALTLLVGHLAGLRDRLALDGYYPAADLVADLVDITDDYLMHPPADRRGTDCCEGNGMVW